MTLVRRSLLRVAALLALPGLRQAAAEGTPAPAGAQLYIISPRDGEQVRGAFAVQFGLRNMGIAPAGIDAPKTGHHHLLIDVDEPLTPGMQIPANANHVHFGGGQTETQLTLPPGTHTLQLVMGDANHMAFDPVIASQKVRVTVA